MEKKFKIRKVPLEMLLNTLDELWQRGAEFVDIEGTISTFQDKVEFMTRSDYFLPLNFHPDDYEHIIYLGP